MGRSYFNFRDVTRRLGIEPSNEAHWAIGHQLLDIAKRNGVAPLRLLTEKTDPNPKVPAPHCIAHYPIEMFEQACQEIGAAKEYAKRQMSFL